MNYHHVFIFNLWCKALFPNFILAVEFFLSSQQDHIQHSWFKWFLQQGFVKEKRSPKLCPMLHSKEAPTVLLHSCKKTKIIMKALLQGKPGLVSKRLTFFVEVAGNGVWVGIFCCKWTICSLYFYCLCRTINANLNTLTKILVIQKTAQKLVWMSYQFAHENAFEWFVWLCLLA